MTRIAAERKLAELMARFPEQLSLRTTVMLTDGLTDPVVEIARRFNPDLVVTSMTKTDRVHRPYSTSSQIASAADQVPMLVLSPKAIGDAFSELRSVEQRSVRTANLD